MAVKTVRAFGICFNSVSVATIEINQVGGRILAQYPPNCIEAVMPQPPLNFVGALWFTGSVPQANIASLHPRAQLAAHAWNMRQGSRFHIAHAPQKRTFGDMRTLEPSQDELLQGEGRGFSLSLSSDSIPLVRYLQGRSAVGVMIVSGPDAQTRFSDAERIKILAEVQEGLTWLGEQEPNAHASWVVDPSFVELNLPYDSAQSEKYWAGPALAQLGYSGNYSGYDEFGAALKTEHAADEGFVLAFTKYNTYWFAYAIISGSKAVFRLNSDGQGLDGWSINSLDQVVAHETGHLFGLLDEYYSSNCSCQQGQGRLGVPNANCALCEHTDQLVECLMKGNSLSLCEYSRAGFGWVVGSGLVEPTPRPIELASPVDGVALAGLSTILWWNNPWGAKWHEVEVMPYNNDGPGIHLKIGDAVMVRESKYEVLAPDFGVGNYVMLPDMTYRWRVRASFADDPDVHNNSDWWPWSAWRSFHTAKRTSEGVSVVSPLYGADVSVARATLRWANSASDVFYYEVQCSTDAYFGEQGSVAPVWHNFIHGGMSSPLNSWTTPELERERIYYWRVRPRIQGDGAPVAWSQKWQFRAV